MDDFETILKKDIKHKSIHYFIFKSIFKFGVLIKLGLEGVISDYKI